MMFGTSRLLLVMAEVSLETRCKRCAYDECRSEQERREHLSDLQSFRHDSANHCGINSTLAKHLRLRLCSLPSMFTHSRI
ncbi:uncharacterized protein K489DRAFT_80575 [Dissoconium aciculare CBS 342.82]|uniref:Secreted protein n=1 Tax=Dissoconium aciculare CBS 342.82 TaxID=1314786 RepID=A0A6J3LU62_9PEZI|nr:uncharacterized protein K489DRAFT_80575 [Dissoconium aciculare CBS 342.82]KAF1818814.1 hypothetical protein K489DRAFT_80575 [Dissoconium aciculare CBS 342.82]